MEDLNLTELTLKIENNLGFTYSKSKEIAEYFIKTLNEKKKEIETLKCMLDVAAEEIYTLKKDIDESEIDFILRVDWKNRLSDLYERMLEVF